MFTPESILYKIFSFPYLLLDILTLIFCKWPTLLVETFFYIFSISTNISNIYLNIIIYIKYDIKKTWINNNKYYKFFYFSIIILFIFSLFIKPYLILENIDANYLKECPFTFEKELLPHKILNYEKRRCELYNIYNNSRYKYQYICSYDATGDFKMNKTSDGLNKLICTKKVNNIKDNNNNIIINKFIEIYENNKIKNFFYCSRTDKPLKNKKTREESCNINIKIVILCIILQCFTYFILIFQISLLEEIEHNNNHLIEEQRHSNDFEISTRCDEENPNNISFKKEKDRNIIVENNQEYSIEVDIKNFEENEEKSKKSTNIEESTLENILNDSNNESN